MLICPEASSAQNNIAAVSADVGFDPSLELLMQALDRVRCSRASPLARRQAGQGEEALAGFLQAVGDRAMTQPPLADEAKHTAQ